MDELAANGITMSKKVIIIGGGVAGLAAGAALAARGIEVSLFELRPFLGGRIYSFEDPATGDFVDNGQHVFTGFYYDTFKFLSLIGSSDHIARQKRLAIEFLDKEGGSFKFEAMHLPKPFHLIGGLLRYPKFPNGDIFRLMKKSGGLDLKDDPMSVAGFLDALGQSKAARANFFRPLSLAMLNAELEDISGRLFQSMLKTIFSVPRSHSVLAYSTVGFSELIAEPAALFITESGGSIYYSAPIRKIVADGDRISGVIDYFERLHTADAYVVALPPAVLAEIVPEGTVSDMSKWRFSPIVSVNIWYDRPVMNSLMAGFLNGNFHWCFDKSSIINGKERHRYVTLLASAAFDKIDLTKEKIIEEALEDMNSFFPVSRSAKVVHVQVIKERKATVLMSQGLLGSRPKVATKFPNLFLAGDWIDTGLPATVESAVRSGFAAAEYLF